MYVCTHPAIRKVNARIYKLVKDEKAVLKTKDVIFFMIYERVVKKDSGHR